MQGDENMERNYNHYSQKNPIYDDKLMPAFEQMPAIHQIPASDQIPDREQKRPHIFYLWDIIGVYIGVPEGAFQVADEFQGSDYWQEADALQGV